jgi:hypothetical protein
MQSKIILSFDSEHNKMQSNGRESTVNRALDGNTYPS